MRNTRQLERIVRGFSNYRRIQMLGLLHKNPNLSVVEVARRLNVNFKTASEHLRRLFVAGLVSKRTAGKEVAHSLTKYGKNVLTFLRTLE